MTPPSPDSTPASSRPTSAEEIHTAVDALAGGAVIGVPTETVYGLAARADSADAMERLRELAGKLAPETSNGGPSPVYHLADPRACLDAAALPAITSRLAQRYWPGPLTLVTQSAAPNGTFDGLAGLAEDNWTKLRAPAHPTAVALLEAAPFPVAVVPAASGADATAVTVQDLRSLFAEDVLPLILDGGTTSLKAPATALAMGPGRFEVLQEGIITEDELRRAAGLNLLFVCTGNTCRSPMAEALARTAIRRALGVQGASPNESNFGFTIASAGVYAGVGAPPSANAVQAMADRDIDLSGHRSSPALDRVVAEADHVYCLTRSHRAALLSMLPPSAADSVELLDPAGRDVPDPFGGPLEVYRETASVIEAFTEARVGYWV